MKKLLNSVFILLIVPSFSIQAQTNTPTGALFYESSVWTGNKFYYNGFKISSDEVERVMRSNNEALQLLRQGNKQANGASVVGGIGGILIGWPVGTAIAGGDPVWELAGIGAGISVISAFIYSSANKKIKRSVDLYNDGNSTSHAKFGIREIQFRIAPSGAGISFTF